ncbi:MAG: ABC transporter ATP-binding protein/permease [Cycloclasticus sp.]|nr:ABC transporter ATP-binding protein/permease [Cycloclasticus sp.]
MMPSPQNKSNLFSELYRLWLCLPYKRKAQLGVLFFLQLLSAFSEVLSLGAIVPFLSALTDINALMEHDRVAVVLEVTGISEPNHLAMLMAGLFAGAIVIANILRFITLWFQMYLAAAIGTDVGAELFRKTLYKPYSYFINNNSSELIGNMTNDLNATLGILQGILMLISQGLIAIAVIIGLLLYDPIISVVLGLTVVCAYTAIIFSIKNRLHRNSTIMSDSYRALIKTLQEGFSGIGFIALSRSREMCVDQYRAADGPYRRSSADNNVIRQAPRFFIEALGVVAISVMAIVLASQTDDMSKVIPLLGFLGLAAHRLLPAGQQIYTSLSATLGLRVSLNRTLDILSMPVSEVLTKTITSPMLLQEELRFNNLCFDYSTVDLDACDTWTLQNLNFTIKAKTTVAFVGQTGSGKSTIADLVLGLLAPQKGSLVVDGVLLNENNMGDWQAGISFVPQNIFLTDASVAENIAFGVRKENIDLDRVHDVARLAQVHGFIETLPNKYDEMVGERGVRLSGGQLQRIGIARALYKNPSVIIFDEATSALDTNTEKEVMSAIEQLSKDITIILIAHRLSTIENVDNIFVLEKGQLVDQGDYAGLLSKNAYFQKLVHGAH